jgi:hypothetical protein
MRISGYSDRGLIPDQIQPEELAEITITVTPDEARRFAAFLLSAADNMERSGCSFSHEHLADKQPGFDSSPHVTVWKA